MADDDLQQVNLRLERLEAKLDTLARPTAAADISAEDVAAFHKVQNAFWEDGTCGINETSPCVLKCNVFTGSVLVPIKIPKVCDVECTCGPCNFGGSFGGISRFRGMGG